MSLLEKHLINAERLLREARLENGRLCARVAELEAAAARVPLTDEQIDRAVFAERDALLDHIYEHGTAAEGVIERVRKLARAALAAQPPAAVPAPDTGPGVITRRRSNCAHWIALDTLSERCDGCNCCSGWAQGIGIG